MKLEAAGDHEAEVGGGVCGVDVGNGEVLELVCCVVWSKDLYYVR